MTAAAAAFVRAFFEGEGLPWVEGPDGLVTLGLTGELAAHFGAEVVVAAREGAAGEPLAVGGRLFDAVVAYLGARGRCAAVTLPRRAMPAPRPWPHRCEAAPLGSEAADRRYAVYDFVLAFLADERREVLWSVALDEVGQSREEVLALLDGPLEDLAGEAAREAAAGLFLRLGEAEHLARARAETLAGSHEARVAAQLAEVTARLTAYFTELEAEIPLRRRRGQAIGEAQAVWEAERAALRRELARRLGQERGRHQLRVLVRALGCAALVVPGQRWRWRLQGDGPPRELVAWQDQASGQVTWSPCERCGRVDGQLGVCTSGHLACPDCLAACEACAATCCRAERVACGGCGRWLCTACVRTCLGGHAACVEDLLACACCGSLTCVVCAAPCPGCPPGEALRLAPGHRCPAHGAHF